VSCEVIVTNVPVRDDIGPCTWWQHRENRHDQVSWLNQVWIEPQQAYIFGIDVVEDFLNVFNREFNTDLSVFGSTLCFVGGNFLFMLQQNNPLLGFEDHLGLWKLAVTTDIDFLQLFQDLQELTLPSETVVTPQFYLVRVNNQPVALFAKALQENRRHLDKQRV
jgi:hypothetical protein